VTNLVLPAISGPVVIGIINEPRKLLISMRLENSDFETSWILRFSASEPELSSVFWLILPSMLHQAGQFHNQLIQPVLFFANRGHLQALKVRVLKVFCLNQ
jgi:hypothetical protein